jgi:hypothetical protein
MYYPRESKRDFLYTKNTILMIFSLVAGLVAAFTFDEAFSYAAIELSFNKSNAKITQIEENQYNSYMLIVTYSFIIKDNSTAEGVFKSNTSALPKIGDDLPIVYSGFSPNYNSRYLNHINKKISFYICSANILIILLSMFFVFRTAKKIQKLKEEDKYY